MRPRLRTLANWGIVALLTLLAAGSIAAGVMHGQLGEVLFNATLV